MKIPVNYIHCVHCLNADSSKIKLLEESIPFFIKKFNCNVDYNVYVCLICNELNYLNLFMVKELGKS